MTALHRVSVVLAVLHFTVALHAADAVAMKTVSVEEFFAGQLQPLPLKLDIPKDYAHAEGLEVEPSYTYWMLPKEVKAAAESGDLPKTGYIWGKISLEVGYLAEEKKFSDEDDFKAQLTAAGHKLVAQKKRNVGGFAVISNIVAWKDEGEPAPRLLFTAYIATNIETNCIYLSYTPPSDFSDTQATQAWNTIVDSISKK